MPCQCIVQVIKYVNNLSALSTHSYRPPNRVGRLYRPACITVEARAVDRLETTLSTDVEDMLPDDATTSYKQSEQRAEDHAIMHHTMASFFSEFVVCIQKTLVKHG